MKIYRALVKFPQAPAAHTLQEARVEASSWGTAARMAVDETVARPHIKGRQHQRVELMLTLVSNGNGGSTDAHED